MAGTLGWALHRCDRCQNSEQKLRKPEVWWNWAGTGYNEQQTQLVGNRMFIFWMPTASACNSDGICRVLHQLAQCLLCPSITLDVRAQRGTKESPFVQGDDDVVVEKALYSTITQNEMKSYKYAQCRRRNWFTGIENTGFRKGGEHLSWGGEYVDFASR